MGLNWWVQQYVYNTISYIVVVIWLSLAIKNCDDANTQVNYKVVMCYSENTNRASRKIS